MERRDVLCRLGAGVLAGTGGCLSRTDGEDLGDGAGGPGDGAGDPGDGAGDDSRGGHRRIVEVTDQQSVPPAVRGSFTARVTRSAITPDQTARLRVSYTNQGPERRFVFGSLAPFTRTRSDGGSPGLLLLPPDRTVETVAPDCWRPPASSHAAAYNATAHPISLTRDESVTRDCEVWGAPRSVESTGDESQGCLPLGSYSFSKPYAFGFQGGTEFTWGFTLRVRRA